LEEQYLGGLESGRMKKGFVAGYGIYATNLRIIGVKTRKALAKGLVGAAIGRVAGAYIGMKLSTDQSVKMIQELEERKRFRGFKTKRLARGVQETEHMEARPYRHHSGHRRSDQGIDCSQERLPAVGGTDAGFLPRSGNSHLKRLPTSGSEIRGP